VSTSVDQGKANPINSVFFAKEDRVYRVGLSGPDSQWLSGVSGSLQMKFCFSDMTGMRCIAALTSLASLINLIINNLCPA
jgi:hypothetical protein